MPYNETDFKHLMNLLELVPWDTQTGSPEVPSELIPALGTDRFSYLTNGVIDYESLLSGGEDPALVYRICMYVMDVFEGAPSNVHAAIGGLVGKNMGFDAPVEALGRRWCDDVAATAWRVLVPYVAEERSAQRERRPGDMTTQR